MIGVARDGPARPPRPGGGSDKRGSVNLMPVGMAVEDGSTVVQGRVEHRRGQLQIAYFLAAFLAAFFLRSAQ